MFQKFVNAEYMNSSILFQPENSICELILSDLDFPQFRLLPHFKVFSAPLSQLRELLKYMPLGNWLIFLIYLAYKPKLYLRRKSRQKLLKTEAKTEKNREKSGRMARN